MKGIKNEDVGLLVLALLRLKREQVMNRLAPVNPRIDELVLELMTEPDPLGTAAFDAMAREHGIRP